MKRGSSGFHGCSSGSQKNPEISVERPRARKLDTPEIKDCLDWYSSLSVLKGTAEIFLLFAHFSSFVFFSREKGKKENINGNRGLSSLNFRTFPGAFLPRKFRYQLLPFRKFLNFWSNKSISAISLL